MASGSSTSRISARTKSLPLQAAPPLLGTGGPPEDQEPGVLKSPLLDRLAKMIALVESHQSWLETITYQMCNMPYAEQSKHLGGPIGLLKMNSTRKAHENADEAEQNRDNRDQTQTGMGRIIENFNRTYKFDAILVSFCWHSPVYSPIWKEKILSLSAAAGFRVRTSGLQLHLLTLWSPGRRGRSAGRSRGPASHEEHAQGHAVDIEAYLPFAVNPKPA